MYACILISYYTLRTDTETIIEVRTGFSAPYTFKK